MFQVQKCSKFYGKPNWRPDKLVGRLKECGAGLSYADVSDATDQAYPPVPPESNLPDPSR
jgi:hypothetical protein